VAAVGLWCEQDEECILNQLIYTITPATGSDVQFLWAVLNGLAVHAGIDPPSPESGSGSAFGKYLAGWGRAGDFGVVAHDQTRHPLGAAWYRLFPAEGPGYGFVAPDVPELSIGVLEHARGQGIGGALLATLLQTAQEQRYRALSLSVDRRNPARRLYERHGFRDASISDSSDSSVTMIALLVPSHSSVASPETMSEERRTTK
jgi:GNAT superfamily N-acetyltransferase